MSTPQEFIELLYNYQDRVVLGCNVFEVDYIEKVNSILTSGSLPQYERVSLNPCVIKRENKNITSFRNFMIESDNIPLGKQIDFINRSGLPFSTIVFSGNKSFHFYVSLEECVGDLETYHKISKWILNILGCRFGLVDHQTITPSCMARLGGGTNMNTGKEQKCKIVRGRIPNKELYNWLLMNIEHEPIIEKKEFVKRSTVPNEMLIRAWIKFSLKEGVWRGKRNSFVFEASIELAACGYDFDQAVEYLKENSNNLINDDFDEQELINTVQSAYRRLTLENKL